MLFFPWWVYLCIVGIIFSAYKLVAAAKEEEKVDQAFIEKEGQIYMERMEKERERRLSKTVKSGDEEEKHSIA
ncbi:sporulation YhaL family protein [Bacillus subtilis]|uniref:Sporulation YhaL family protein n=1 Tax=Bacillus subtilis TaxID=1423 RepID=A0AAX3RQM6_BACIU|nr:sporulation YhaL family protein [Bacillus inaquosorum]MED3602726.1 sporulation YhaL family protein [Bacillus subtilis]MCY8723626.1 sporulation YhaL family protein [Bacillus inaquosorum]MCY8787937.1 sporulation YhaL family protein [Bacillus inaquosorum]MCY9010598.1 sporulation YhaL family protein [Bacillus inaquosorum]MCY9034063.1 sporulation YhaL family protein [Bacillus inaquosorum]